MTGSPDWGPARRFGFRFGIVFGALLIVPFPLDALPGLGWLTEPARKPLVWATRWFGQAVLGLRIPEPSALNGSGDRTFDHVQLLVIAIVAAISAIAWSALARRRSYPRLAAAAHVVLRYYLAYAMLAYGLSKVLRQQYSDLTPHQLGQRVGDLSPMGLLWRFMNYSAPYTVFAGLCEVIPGALLLWRRTAAIGAVMVIAVMTNVVMLNLSYDVAVKLYSMQLLVMAGLIALPDARRLLAAALGRATAEVPARVRMSPRRERLRWIAKAGLLVAIAVGLVLELRSGWPDAHRHELYGTWVVDTFAVDGVEHPPLTTDPVRWHSMTAHVPVVRIRWMTGEPDSPGPDRDYYFWKVDETSHTITVTIDADKNLEETWRYSRPAPDRLVIDGMHLGKSLHVALRAAPPSRLMTRGFHWINEAPFNP